MKKFLTYALFLNFLLAFSFLILLYFKPNAIKHVYHATIREGIGLLAGVKSDDTKEQIILKLRNHLYKATNKIGPNINPTSNDSYRYFLTLTNQTDNLCSSIAVTYIWMLSMFDIPSREVILKSKDCCQGKQNRESHVIVEAIANNKIFVSDPTFNVSFNCSNGQDQLSAVEMKKCISEGNKLLPVYGMTKKPRRTLEEYYISIDKLLYSISGKRKNQNNQIFPEFEIIGSAQLDKALLI